MPVKSKFLHFLMRVGLHVLIAVFLFLLYSPWNKHPNNTTGSSMQFVYQQF